MLKDCSRKNIPGTFKIDIGLKEIYNYYLNSCKYKKQEPIIYRDFARIIKYCNTSLVDSILETGDPIKLPYRLGELRVVKRERQVNLANKNKWNVDYKKSKELGFIVYHDSIYKYNWMWDKTTASKGSIYGYKFIPCRKLSRKLAASVISGKDYYLQKTRKHD